MLTTLDKRHAFWDALRRLAPDISTEAFGIIEVRARLRARLDALTDRPLADDDATALFHRLGVLYNESFRGQP